MSRFRIVWVRGTDQLLGTCHCGAERVGDDPIALWAWLHGHPVGHGDQADEDPSTAMLVPRPVGVGA
jgi:hypothetical protein